MSDSAQNVEIEDVLSSIRRLVSGDDWTRVTPAEPAESQPAPQPDAASAPATPEKFVLTPVLRVVERPGDDGGAEPAHWASVDVAQQVDAPTGAMVWPEDPAQPESVAPVQHDAGQPTDPEPESSDPLGVDAADPVSDPVSDLIAPEEALVFWEAAPEEPEQDAEQTNTAVTDMPEADTPEADTPAADMPVADEQAGQVDDIEVPDVSEPASLSEGRLHIEATIAELEAAVGGQSDEWEPDGSEVGADDTPPGWTAPPTRRAFVADPDAQDIETDDPEEEITFHHVGPEFVSPEHLEDLAAGLGAGAAAIGAGAATYGAELDENLNAYLESESVIDEQALRELVADIVRQELQGALGERITRNVRKLVRREIYRVLASQEFD